MRAGARARAAGPRLTLARGASTRRVEGPPPARRGVVPGDGALGAALVGVAEALSRGAFDATTLTLVALGALPVGFAAAAVAHLASRLREGRATHVGVRVGVSVVGLVLGTQAPAGFGGFGVWIIAAAFVVWASPQPRPRALEPIVALVAFSLSVVSLAREAEAPTATSASALASATRAAIGWVDPALTPSAPPPAEPTPLATVAGPRPVLVISVDALRWDRLGAHGHARAKTPALDELARSGVDFQFAYTASTDRARAFESLATGLHVAEWLDAGAGSAERSLASAYAGRDGRPRFVDVGVDPRSTYDVASAVRTRVAPGELFQGFAGPVADAGLTWVHLGDLGRTGPRLAPSAEHDRIARAVDDAVHELVARTRDRAPETVVVFTALGGDDFGERVRAYGDATVYEEAVRVPLVINAPGLLAPARPATPVSLVDVAPSIAAWAGVGAISPAHGRSFADALATGAEPAARPLLTKSARMSMIADGPLRLVCTARATCALFDLTTDPRQRTDLAGSRPDERERLMRVAAELRLELLSSSGKAALLARTKGADAVARASFQTELGIPGARGELEALLGAGEEATRLAAARALFDLRDQGSLAAARAAMERESAPAVREALALLLVRLGDTVPLARDLLVGADLDQRRLAALAFAEHGDDRGADTLLTFWREAFGKDDVLDERVMSPRRAGEVAMALGLVQKREAVGELIRVLGDPRLVRDVALALAAAGEDAARPALAAALARAKTEDVDAIAEALLELGGGPEMAAPLVGLLGRPEPPERALAYAVRARVLRFAGGPTREAEAERLRRFATSGVLTDFVVPKPPKRTTARSPQAVRVVCRAGASDGGEIRVGKRRDLPLRSEKKAAIPATQPELEADATVTLSIPAGEGAIEVHGELPRAVEARHGKQVSVVVYATQGVAVEACALVPMLE